MAPKAKKEAPAPPNMDTKTDFEGKESSAESCLQPHKKGEDPHVTHLPMAKDTVAPQPA